MARDCSRQRADDDRISIETEVCTTQVVSRDGRESRGTAMIRLQKRRRSVALFGLLIADCGPPTDGSRTNGRALDFAKKSPVYEGHTIRRMFHVRLQRQRKWGIAGFAGHHDRNGQISVSRMFLCPKPNEYFVSMIASATAIGFFDTKRLEKSPDRSRLQTFRNHPEQHSLVPSQITVPHRIPADKNN